MFNFWEGATFFVSSETAEGSIAEQSQSPVHYCHEAHQKAKTQIGKPFTDPLFGLLFPGPQRAAAAQGSRGRLLRGCQPRPGRHTRYPGPPPRPGGQVARQEDQTPPAARPQALPGGREAGAGLASEPRGGVPPEERRDRPELAEGEGLPEESRNL